MRNKTAFVFALFCVFLLSVFFFCFQNFNLYDDNSENGKYTAVIIEPREHKALAFVLKNFLDNLSDEWNILIMHGNKNVDFVANIIDNDLAKYRSRIQLHNLQVDNLTIDDYNQLLVNEEFYQHIPTEIFLIFQTDTMICNKDKLNEFLDYDYVGAPWSWLGSEKKGGNGGLSLRRKSKMLEKIRQCKNTEDEYEDMYFSNSCGNLNFPKYEKAKRFSVETVYNDDSFGIHKPWSYLSEEQLQVISQKCIGFNTLVEFNK